MDEAFRSRFRGAVSAAKRIQAGSPKIRLEPELPSGFSPSSLPLRPEPQETIDSNHVQAFVSWAHTHAEWDRETAREWERKVATFTTTLRTPGGIEADVDLYHAADPSIDWGRFGPNSIANMEYILIVLSKSWAERWSGTNRPTEGAGAVGEADALHGLFEQHQAEWQRRVKMIIFPGVENDLIPLELRRLARFRVDPDDIDSYDSLLRTLTDQPLYVPPPVTSVPILPPAVLESASRTSSGKRRRGTDQELLVAEMTEIRRRIRRLPESSEERASLEQEHTVIQSVIDAMSQND